MTGYSLHNRKILAQPIQLILTKKQKKFSQLLARYLKSTSNFEHVEKKTTLIGYVFPKFETAKHVVS